MKTVVALVTLLSVAAAADKFIGKLSTLQHDVSGDLYARDDLTLVLKDFTYDGAGPDAFFWIGKTGTPKNTDNYTTLILAHPFEGYNYEYSDLEAPVLRRYKKEEVVLNLPKNFKVPEIKWFSVWCRQFAVDFGNVMFPSDFSAQGEDELPHPLAPASTEEPAAEPEAEPEAEPGYDHNDHGDHQEKWKPEAKPEPKPRPAGAAATTVTTAVVFLSLIAAKFY